MHAYDYMEREKKRGKQIENQKEESIMSTL